jgi:sulfatase modifying factor 1
MAAPASSRRAAGRALLALLAGTVALPAGAADPARTSAPRPAAANSVLVPGGSFQMGTPASAIPELRRRYSIGFPGVFEDEAPQHAVTVSSFRLDSTEVTISRFAAFLAAHGEWRRSRLDAALQNGHYLEDWAGDAPPADGDRPVVFVTWHAAQAFCRSAGGRLPTEAEWEYAARARGDIEFPWGDALPSPARANYAASGIAGTARVGSYPPNALGVFDLAGNVWEFTLDAWAAYPSTAQRDPVAGGPVTDRGLLAVVGRRVIRGGSFGGSAANLRTRWRDSHVVTNAVGFVGFRCAYPPAGR